MVFAAEGTQNRSMADNSNPPNLFNPMMMWADLSLQALDMSWSTMQNMNDGVDRMTRAVASAEPGEGEAFSGAVDRASV